MASGGSEILCRWLNNDVVLEEVISPASFATQFASGHLLGQVLYKHGLQDDFEKFLPGTTAESKLRNWKLLAPTFRLLDIHMDAETAHSCMDSITGVANKLVYQLFVMLSKGDQALKSLQLRKSDSRKDRSNAASDMHYQQLLTRKTMREADAYQIELEVGFERKFQQADDKLRAQEAGQVRRLEEMRKVKIKESFDRSQVKKQEFNDRIAVMEAEWTAKAAAIFSAARPGTVDLSATAKTAASVRSPASRLDSARSMSRRPSSAERLRPLELSGSLSQSPNLVTSIRSRKTEVDTARRERGKRRQRAIIRESALRQEAQEESQKELLMSKVLRSSQQERRIAMQLLQRRHEEHVIRENRSFRTLQQQERRRKDFEEALQREADTAQRLRVENAADIAAKAARTAALREARELAAAAETAEAADAVVRQIVDFATACVEYRAVNEGELPTTHPKYRELKKLVMEGVPIYGDAEDTAAEKLDDQDFKLYTELGAEWGTVLSESSTEADADAAAEEAAPPPPPPPPPENPGCNRILGHILHRINTIVEPPAPTPELPPIPKARTRAAIVGKPFCWKTESIEKVAGQLNVAIISPRVLVEEAIAAAAAGETEREYCEKYGLEYTPLAPEPEVEVEVEVEAEAEAEAEAVPEAPSDSKAPAGEEAAAPAEEAAALIEGTATPTEEPNAKELAAAPTGEPTQPTEESTTEAEGGDCAASTSDEAAAEAAPEAEPEVEVDVAPASDPPSTRATVGLAIRDQVAAGEPVPALEMVQLVILAMQKAPTENGWVLDGFPTTRKEAALLEKATYGFDENLPDPYANMSAVAPVAEDEQVRPNATAFRCFDAVISFVVDDQVCLERAEGRRIDPADGTVYHLEGLGFPKPPAVPKPDDVPVEEIDADILGLHERLEPLKDEFSDANQLHIRLDTWNIGHGGVKGWYEQFGLYRTIDASDTKDGLADALVGVMLDVQKTEERALEAALEATIAADMAALEMTEQAEADFDEQEAAEDALESELEADTADANQKAEAARLAEEREALSSAGKKKKKPKSGKKKKGGDDEELPEGADLEAFIQDEDKERLAAALAANVPKKPGEVGYGYVSDQQPLDLQLAGVLKALWGGAEKNYVDTTKQCLFEGRLIRDDTVDYLHDCRVSYAEFLTRPDAKQEFVAKWQHTYNLDIAEDMRDDPDTKAELHMRASDLKALLLDICDKREEEGQQDLEVVKTNGYIEDQLTMVSNIYVGMMQAEVDRYTDTSSLFQDYYGSAKEEIVAEALVEKVTLDMMDTEGSDGPDGLDGPDGDGGQAEAPAAAAAAEDEEVMEGAKDAPVALPVIPRGEDKAAFLKFIEDTAAKLVATVVCPQDPNEIREQRRLEEEKQREADEKANAKKKKPKKGEPEEELEVPSAEQMEAERELERKRALFDGIEDEYFAAAKLENDRFKFRTELIHQAALQAIESLWDKALKLWGHMEKCLKIRYDSEVESVNELIKTVQTAIEAEEKLLHELVLEDKDFFINHQIYMFEPPKPDPNPTAPTEAIDPNRFTIAQLSALVDQLLIVSPNHTMPKAQLVKMVQGLSSVAAGTDALPEACYNLKASKVDDLFKALGYGLYIDWRHFIFVAMDLPEPTANQLFEVASALTPDPSSANDVPVSEEAFVAARFWFDSDTDSPFDRNTACKQLLFRLLSPVNAVTASLWLCRMADPVAAFGSAMALHRGAPFAVPEGVIGIEETLAILNHGKPTMAVSLENDFTDPGGRAFLVSAWSKLEEPSAGALLTDEATKVTEVANLVSARFGCVKLADFINVVPESVAALSPVPGPEA